jgi:hypothetical protein
MTTAENKTNKNAYYCEITRPDGLVFWGCYNQDALNDLSAKNYTYKIIASTH